MSDRDLWLKKFEALTGRPPKVDELLKGKSEGFDLERLKADHQVEAQALEQSVVPATQSSHSKRPVVMYHIVMGFPIRILLEITLIFLSILLSILSFTQEGSYLFIGFMALFFLIFLGGVIGKPVKSIKKDWMFTGFVLVVTTIVMFKGIFRNPYLVSSYSNDPRTYHGKADPFDWTLEDLETYANTETSVSKVIHDHGKPNGTEMWDETKGDASLSLTYLSSGDDRVALDFTKGNDNRWVLTSIYAVLTPPDVKLEGNSYQFDWSQDDIDRLEELDYSTGFYNVPSQVTTWDNVKKKHPKVSDASLKYSVELDYRGVAEPSYELTIEYVSDKKELTLEFVSQDGQTYYLSHWDDSR